MCWVGEEDSRGTRHLELIGIHTLDQEANNAKGELLDGLTDGSCGRFVSFYQTAQTQCKPRLLQNCLEHHTDCVPEAGATQP